MVNYVNFIQSSGTQYIDTGFVPNQNTRLKAKLVCIVGSSTVWAMGARISNTSNMFGFIASSSGYYMSQYGSNRGAIDASYNKKVPFILDKNKNVTMIDDETVITSTVESFSCPSALTLFAMNNNGTINKGSISLYECKIYDNGTLVRDFWPCYDPDGVACLYDKVEKKYYYNAGSGEFTAG